jgi:hypothetical protein
MSGVEHVHFGGPHILAIAFRLAGNEREIVFAPDDEKLRLRVLRATKSMISRCRGIADDFCARRLT